MRALIALGAVYLSAVAGLAVLLAIVVGIEYWGRGVAWWMRRRIRIVPALRALPVLHDARDAQLARDTEIVRRALERANRPTRAPHHRAARRLTMKATTRRITQ